MSSILIFGMLTQELIISSLCSIFFKSVVKTLKLWLTSWGKKKHGIKALEVVGSQNFMLAESFWKAKHQTLTSTFAGVTVIADTKL